MRWLLLLFVAPVFAGGTPDIVINNNITEVVEVRTEVNTITSGLSEDDLAQGVSMAAASGGHQFDWSTYRYQASITGAWFDSNSTQDAVSFGVGKRWEKVDALFHANYGQAGSDHLVVIGATFRW